MKDPKISVVIPAFNAGRWIEATLESVAAQTFQDWEIVVVDDGSEDDTAARVRASVVPRVRLLTQANLGPTGARNRGFREARGDYVALLDADDRYEPRFLEITTRSLDENPPFGIVATNNFLVDQFGNRSVAFQSSCRFLSGTSLVEADYCRIRLRERSFPQNTAMVLRKELIVKLGGYDPTIMFGEEIELILRWTCSTHLGYIPEALVTHYDRPGSFIKDLERSVRGRVHLWKRIMENDREYLEIHKGYGLLRNYCLFRIVAVSMATGHFREVKEIAGMWPPDPKDRFWWAGQTLARSPACVQKFIYTIIGGTKAVRYRNDPCTVKMIDENEK